MTNLTTTSKIRRACDRCHTQKLRCIRSEHESVCVRCARAGLVCVFSPPTRHRRSPSEAKRLGCSQALNSAVHPTRSGALWSPDSSTLLELDPSATPLPSGLTGPKPAGILDPLPTATSDPFTPVDGFNWDHLLNTSPPIALVDLTPGELALTTTTFSTSASPLSPIHPLQTSPASRIPLQPHRSPPEPTALPTRTEWVAELGRLNVTLLTHAQQIAHRQPRGTPSTSSPTSATDHDFQEDRPTFAVDQTFLLSQQLIDLLSQQDALAATGAPTQSPPPGPPQLPRALRSLDPASILLVLSCHLRVLDSYSQMFAHIQAWQEHGPSSSLPATGIGLPALNIGAFSLPASSPRLQIAVILQLAEQLLGRLREMVLLPDVPPPAAARSLCHEMGASHHSTAMHEVVSITLQAISARELGMTKTISWIKRSLQES
ncbi:hypothetical protein ASPBRDRAFT_138529 [Aspergillus brasiliensis CBS 101740]|uniref:Zn(2)-C6 fungal-type domain-containing protein n=1 Tax=Aspergillus brasiliensis (strain CBS 101740 / IMI 381727 / IBT 21946) TaxID=767769 RepID=A0A1L9U3M1_ASPBC|nr:hypothetical protein ASPBRDRAFT_138529 [Aspergillus brasiliensis CBS 101740]